MWGEDGEDYAVMNWSSLGRWNDLGERSPEWQPYPFIVEVPDGVVDDDRWHFAAPAPFLGDKEDAYGHTVRFELKPESYDVCDGSDVALAGGELFLTANIDQASEGEWKQHAVALDPSGEWKKDDAMLASESEIRSVLSDLRVLMICAGKIDVVASSEIDSVVLIGPGTVHPSIEPAGRNGEGHETFRLSLGPRGALGMDSTPQRHLSLAMNPQLKVRPEGITVDLGAKLAEVKNVEPASMLQRVRWRRNQPAEDELSEIVEGVRMMVDGDPRPLTAVVTAGEAYRYERGAGLAEQDVIIEVDLEFLGAKRTVIFPVGEARDQRLALANARAHGVGRPTQAQAVVLAPSAQITDDGHFDLYLPRNWFGDPSMELDLYLEERVDGQWDKRHQALRVRPKPAQNAAVRLRLDDAFGIYALKGGPYRVRVEIARPNEVALAHRFASPAFNQDYINLAINSRLQVLSRELLGVPFAKWQQVYDDDEDEGEYLLWKGLHDSTELHAQVTVENLSPMGATFERDIVLLAELDQGSLELQRRKMLVGTPYTAKRDVTALPFGSVTTVEFDAPRLAKNMQQHRQLLQRVRSLVFEVQPTRAGAEAERVKVPFEAVIPSDACWLLAHAIRQEKPTYDDDDESYEPFEDALDAVLEDDNLSDGSKAVYQECKDRLNSRYKKEFLPLVERLGKRMEALGEDSFAALELAVRNEIARGHAVSVGRPSAGGEGPAFRGASEDGWDHLGTYTLSHGILKRIAAGVAVAANPQLGFTVDRMVLGLEDPVAGRPASGVVIPGIDRWRLPEEFERAGELAQLRLLRRLKADAELARMLSSVLEANNGQISNVVARKRDVKVFSGAKGQIHEEASRKAVAKRRLQQLERAFPGLRGRIVPIPGEYIKATGISGTAGLQYVDFAYAVVEKGQLRLLGTDQAKSGHGSAQGVGLQMARDVVRAKAHGLELDLPAALASRLGLPSGSHSFSPDKITVDFTSGSFFGVVVPRGTQVPDRITPNQRSQLLASARSAGVALTDKEFTAIERAMKNPHRTRYDQKTLRTLTELLLARSGSSAKPWNYRELTHGELTTILKRDKPGVSQKEIDRAFARGLRYDIAAKKWVPVFEKWERPVMTEKEYRQHIHETWKRVHGKAPTKQQVERESNNFYEGRRLHPQTARSRSADAASSKMYIADLRLPVQHLPHRDFMVAFKASGLAEKHKIPEDEIRNRRAKGEVFIPRNGNWTLSTSLDPGRVSHTAGKRTDLYPWQLKLDREARRLYQRKLAVRAGGFLAAGRAAHGWHEFAKLGNEKLIARLYRNQSSVRVIVELQTNGKPIPLSTPQMVAILQLWYRSAHHTWGSGELPSWLKSD